MGIVLTEEEKKLMQEGKLNPSDILEHRKINPVRTIDVNELDKVKQEIRDTNILYKDSIQKNKDLYDELQENRKRKEELRNKIAELRLKKKQLLGLE
ncbi:MAG: hypothetical protein V1729_04895 [Candidatus Woesearchaeota archaeon]